MVIDALRRSGAIADGDPLATLAPAPMGGHEEFLDRLLDGLARLTSLLTRGDVRNYVAGDHLEVEGLCGEAAIAELKRHGLAFDPRRGVGVVLHMLGCAGPLGRIGATALGATADEARALYDAVAQLLAAPAVRAAA